MSDDPAMLRRGSLHFVWDGDRWIEARESEALQRPNVPVLVTRYMDLLEAAWGIIANAHEGNWDKERPEWQEAAARWREDYHEVLGDYLAKVRPERKLSDE